mgnify:CR=1 FL=1
MPPPPQAVPPTPPPPPSDSDSASRAGSEPLESDQETIHDHIRDSRLEFDEEFTEESWRGSLQAPAEGPVEENEFEHEHEHGPEPESEYDSVADFLREIREDSAEPVDQNADLPDLAPGHELERIPEDVDEDKPGQEYIAEQDPENHDEHPPQLSAEAQITPKSIYELGPGNRPQSSGTFASQLKYGQDHQRISDGVIVDKFLETMRHTEKPRPKARQRERWDLPGGLPLLPPSPTRDEDEDGDGASDSFPPPSPARNSAANFLKRMSDSSTTTDQLRAQSVCSGSDSGAAAPEERDSMRNSRLPPAENEKARGSMLAPLEWSNVHRSSQLPAERLSIRRSGFRPLYRDLFRDSSWSPTYMLKPQTYTPRIPPPEPSPMLKKDEKSANSEEAKPSKGKDLEYEFLNEGPPPPSAASPASKAAARKSKGLTLRSRMSVYPDDDIMSKKSSLRSRVSRPMDISIPPPSPGRRAVLGQSSLSPTHPMPEGVNYDSTYGSDVDRTLRQLRPRGNSTNELPPGSSPVPVPSPNSENQFYRPVMASPHSPLQRRPHTAAGGIDSVVPGSPGNSSGASHGPSIGPSPEPSPGQSPGFPTGLSPGPPTGLSRAPSNRLSPAHSARPSTGLSRGPSNRLSPAHSARPSTGLSPGLSTTMSSGPSAGQAPYPSPYRSPYPSPSPYQPRHHIRNKPSQILGVTTVNGVTHAVYDTPGQSPHAESPGIVAGSGPGQLKKKKSAFGWFKKAFTMDEDERAAFEQRRSSQAPSKDQYYENSSPRFLDGKRIR